MKIVTGHRGEDHVTSNDIQAFNIALFGAGQYVLGVGQEFSADLIDATHVKFWDGEGIMSGVHFRIPTGQTETVTIDPGELGKQRIDLICARYTKDALTGVEDVSLHVITGISASSGAVAPDYESGDVLYGDTVDFPLYTVHLDGLTPQLDQLFIPKRLRRTHIIESTSGVHPANETVTFTFPITSIDPFVAFPEQCLIISCMQKQHKNGASDADNDVWVSSGNIYNNESGVHVHDTYPTVRLYEDSGSVYAEVKGRTTFSGASVTVRLSIMVITNLSEIITIEGAEG